jgi:hypothetical protein
MTSPERSLDPTDNPTPFEHNLSPEEARLAEVFTPSEHRVAEFTPRFDQAVDQALALALQPHDQDAIRAAADLARWQLFAKPGTPLPENFVLLRPFNDETPAGIAYGPEQSINEHCLRFGTDRLEHHGLFELAENMHREFATEETAEAIQAYLTALPVYKLLRSFGEPSTEADQTETPVQKAHAYFAPHVHLSQLIPDEQKLSVQDTGEQDPEMLALKASAVLFAENQFPTESPLEEYAQTKMIDLFLHELFHNPEKFENYPEHLDQIGVATLCAVYEEVGRSRVGLASYHGFTPAQWLWTPSGPTVVNEFIFECNIGHDFVGSDRIAVLRKSEYQLPVGTVHKFNPDNNEPRLISLAPCNAALPQSTKGDLILTLNEIPTATDPVIPGYELVGRTNRTYSFNQAESDPYAPVEITLPPEKVAALATEYGNIGLTDLGKAVSGRRDLTTTALTKLLRAHHKECLQQDLDTQFLLKVSLEHLFGSDAVHSELGFVLTPDQAEVPGITEMHSVLTYDGKTHIMSVPATNFEKSIFTRSMLKILDIDPEFP